MARCGDICGSRQPLYVLPLSGLMKVDGWSS